MAKDKSIIILADQREKTPYDYKPYIYRGVVERVDVVKLETGDYTMPGYENIICVERKAPGDICSCIFEKRFRAELERMQLLKESHVVIDADIEYLADYPRWLPASVQSRIKVDGPLVLRQILEYQHEYPLTRWHFAGFNGAGWTLGLLRCAARHYQPTPPANVLNMESDLLNVGS